MTDSLTVSMPTETADAPVYQYYAGGEWKNAADNGLFESYEPYTGRVFARVAAGGPREMADAITAAHEAFPAWAATPPSDKAALLLKAAEIIKRRTDEIADMLARDRQHAAVLPVPAGTRRRHPEAGRRLGLPAQRRGAAVQRPRHPLSRSPAAARCRGQLHTVEQREHPLVARHALADRRGQHGRRQAIRVRARQCRLADRRGRRGGRLPGRRDQRRSACAGRGAGDRRRGVQPARGARHQPDRWRQDRAALRRAGRAHAQADRARARRLQPDADPRRRRHGLRRAHRDVRVLLPPGPDLPQHTQDHHRAQPLRRVPREVRRAHVPSGDPLDPKTIIGPLVTPAAVQLVHERVQDAVTKGATVQIGGTYKGQIYQPTILTDVSYDAVASNEETFGPLVIVEPVDSDEHAAQVANRVNYGLTSSILTSDTFRGFELAQRIEHGIVNVNSPTVNDEIHAPMGGVKDSGWGRTGPDSIADFSDVIWINARSGQREYPF